MTELFIDGEWAAGTGHAFASRNPGTGATVWEGNSASADDVDRAVRSARRAFATWSALSLDERCAIVRRFAALLTERKESLAEAIGRETGKPLWEARTEVASMAAKVEISIQAYHERTGEKRFMEYAPNVPLKGVAFTYLVPPEKSEDADALQMAAAEACRGASPASQAGDSSTPMRM